MHDKDNKELFQKFLDLYSNSQGLLRVNLGDDLVKFCRFFVILAKVIKHNRHFDSDN